MRNGYILVGAVLWAQTQAVAPALPEKSISGTEVPPERGAMRRPTATSREGRDTTLAIAPEVGKRLPCSGRRLARPSRLILGRGVCDALLPRLSQRSKP